MPDHGRDQVVDAVITQVTGLTTTGSNVVDSPVYPFSTLPALAVYPGEEEIVADTRTLGKRVVRRLEVKIEGRAKEHSEADPSLRTVLGTICAEVEAAIADDESLAGLVRSIELAGTETEFSGEEEQPVGKVTMTWVADYATTTDDPTTVLGYT